MSNLLAEPNCCQVQGERRDIWSFLITHSNIVQIIPYYKNSCTVNGHKVEWRHKLFKKKQNSSVTNNLFSGKYSIKVKGIYLEGVALTQMLEIQHLKYIQQLKGSWELVLILGVYSRMQKFSERWKTTLTWNMIHHHNNEIYPQDSRSLTSGHQLIIKNHIILKVIE